MPSYSGSFLVARPALRDPSFARTVVLLLQHGPEGAFGVIVNRPAEGKKLPFPVFAGGPCPSQGLLMVHGHKEWVEASEVPVDVAPGIFIGDSSCLARVSDPSPGQVLRYRMFVGYAGWGPGQLDGELAANAWAIVPARGDVLFDTPADELWECLLPPSIPQPSVN